MKKIEQDRAAYPLKRALEEEVTVTLTWFELTKIRDWNLQRMESAIHALENPIMKPAKRSRWQAEYDFHSQLCDHLHGVDPDEDDKIREHNENLRSGIDMIERVMSDMIEKKTKLERQLI